MSQRLDKHFAACCAAAAGAAYLASPSTATADIVYSQIQNSPIFPGAVNGGVYIDFENPAATKQGTSPRTDPNVLVPGWEINPYFSGISTYLGRPSTGVVLSSGKAANLADGTLISSASSFSGTMPAGTGFYGGVNIPTGQTGYIGFRFDPNGVAGMQTWYGWMRISVGSNVSPTSNGNVIDWAYDNTGAGIQAGVVPEPSSIALLAMGAAGLLALRRCRAKA